MAEERTARCGSWRCGVWAARWVALVLACGSAQVAIAQQTNQAQPSGKQQGTVAGNASSDGKPGKSAAEENPFPTATSEQAAKDQQQKDAPPPDAPDGGQAAPAAKPGNAAQQNPFPEDVSRRAAAQGNDSGDASGVSSSNPGGGDAGAGADIPPDTSGRRRLPKPKDSDIQGGSLAGQGRAQEDVKVGRFYLNTGDYKGAYDRFSDASRMDPTNLEAIYGLGAAAEGLHRNQEAVENYKLYLAVAPDGEEAKSVRKKMRALMR